MIIAKYKFDSSIDTLPTFNSNFVYTFSDTNNEDGSITRIIESENLPTSISFSEREGLLEVEKIETSNLISMNNMFYNCKNVTKIECSDWDTSKVTSINNTFYGCSSLTSLDLSDLNTSKITTMNGTFYNCNNLTSIDFRNWNDSNLTTMSNTFQGCPNLSLLDLSYFNMNKVESLYQTFRGCTGLVSLDISNCNFEITPYIFQIFFGCSKLRKIKNFMSGISVLLNELESKSSSSPGYLFVRENIAVDNSKNWNRIICNDITLDVVLSHDLKEVNGIKDKLYWDYDKGYYCIEQNIGDDYMVLTTSNIIELPHLNQKYSFDTYTSTTNITCSNLPLQPSRMYFATDYKEYHPSINITNSKYILQFACTTKTNSMLKIDFGGKVQYAKTQLGINQISLSTLESPINKMKISPNGNIISNIMLFKGELFQTPDYFDGVQSVGELQSDGSYKIDIKANNEFTISIKTDKPLSPEDKLYWDLSNERYEIDRDGVIEIPIVEGDNVNLPRLYQKTDTNILISTDYVNPSDIKIFYKDIKDL